MRLLGIIARDIRVNWPKISPMAKPYLEAMATLDTIDDKYLFESGRSIVSYFLANAGGWRGDEAKRIKAELRELLK